MMTRPRSRRCIPTFLRTWRRSSRAASPRILRERYESTRDLARDLKSIEESSTRQTVAAPARSRSTSRRAVVIAVAVVLIAAAASAAWWWRSRPVAGVAERERPLIAVRPFTSLSTNPAAGLLRSRDHR